MYSSSTVSAGTRYGQRSSHPSDMRRKHPTYELITIGWGGMASNAAGLKVRDTCEACKYRDYTIADPLAADRSCELGWQ